jgi:hypothetical protein
MSKRWAALPKGIRWLAGGIAAVVLAVVVAWVLFIPAADWLADHDVGSAHGPLLQTARDDARGRLLTLGAGLFAAAALIFTALNFNLLRRNSEQTDQWQRRTYQLTEQGQVTDRYTKAIEQLGSDKLDVRVGGIYALERIARDSARDHSVVMEVLTAFIREHSREDRDPSAREHWDPSEPNSAEPPRPDIQAAITVVGRLDAEPDIQPVDLTGVCLRGANLVRANLVRADLFRADLSGASLVRADLSGSHLREADLTGADLQYANLAGANLECANLECAELTGADLTRAELHDAILTGAYLVRADLAGANLDGVEGIDPADFRAADDAARNEGA